MKRYICLIISLCLILGSFSFVFASPTSWDTNDQSNLLGIFRAVTSYGTGNLFYKVSHIDTTLNSISSDILTIKGYLFDDGHSIAYWTSAISSWMSPIYQSLTSLPTSLTQVENGLWWDLGNGSRTEYLRSLAKGLTNYGYLDSNESARYTAHQTLFSSGYNYQELGIQDGGRTYSSTWSWTNGSPLGNLALILTRNNSVMANSYAYRWAADLTGYNSQQTALNWGSLGNAYFTPNSATDGIYKWFAAIQAPVARLSYVLASDERIAAQQAASVAEQEVVDDFIDPTGDSSATASDFGSISDLSSGYQQNFGSTASVTGIFDIFDSNNFGWFSSETYQQLDTTVAQRGSSFETPLLDQQLEDISRALGVDYAN